MFGFNMRLLSEVGEGAGRISPVNPSMEEELLASYTEVPSKALFFAQARTGVEDLYLRFEGMLIGHSELEPFHMWKVKGVYLYRKVKGYAEPKMEISPREMYRLLNILERHIHIVRGEPSFKRNIGVKITKAQYDPLLREMQFIEEHYGVGDETRHFMRAELVSEERVESKIPQELLFEEEYLEAEMAAEKKRIEEQELLGF